MHVLFSMTQGGQYAWGQKNLKCAYPVSHLLRFFLNCLETKLEDIIPATTPYYFPFMLNIHNNNNNKLEKFLCI